MSNTRYLRQEMLSLYEGQNPVLQNKCVAILGVGGMGGSCSLLLALAGIGKIKIADGDHIDMANLHRQLLFTEGSVGQSKVRCAMETIKAHQSETEVEAYEAMINQDNFADFINGADIIMDLTDHSASRVAISQLALKHHIDLISGAVSGYRALLGIFEYSNPDFIAQHGCYRCLTSGDHINTKVGITGPIAASASSLVSHMALEYLLGERKHVGKVINYDLKELRIQHFKLVRAPDCPHCGQE